MEATVDKCLAFCQALVSSNQKFTFTLSIGKETFKFNNQELVASSCVKSKKKKSPCQLRREDRRREARKLKIAEQVVEVPHSATLNKQLKRLLLLLLLSKNQPLWHLSVSCATTSVLLKAD